MATVTIMLIAMAAAVPSWEYVMKDDREQELIFRGGEIADAIQRYQQRNGNALPPNLEVLVKGKFLRREYGDPMTKDGKWRFIRQGESIGPIRPPGTPGSSTGAPNSPTPGRQTLQSPAAGSSSSSSGSSSQRTSSFSSPTGTVGGIQGVASTSQDEGLRIFNGRTKYSEWVFMPGQPRQVGRAARTPGAVGGVPGAPTRPAGAPTVPGGAPTVPGGLPGPPTPR